MQDDNLVWIALAMIAVVLWLLIQHVSALEWQIATLQLLRSNGDAGGEGG